MTLKLKRGAWQSDERLETEKPLRSAMRRQKTNEDLKDSTGVATDGAAKTPEGGIEEVTPPDDAGGALARYSSMGTLLTSRDTEDFVETLQNEYKALLVEHARAKNVIDQLKIGAKVNFAPTAGSDSGLKSQDFQTSQTPSLYGESPPLPPPNASKSAASAPIRATSPRNGAGSTRGGASTLKHFDNNDNNAGLAYLDARRIENRSPSGFGLEVSPAFPLQKSTSRENLISNRPSTGVVRPDDAAVDDPEDRAYFTAKAAAVSQWVENLPASMPHPEDAASAKSAASVKSGASAGSATGDYAELPRGSAAPSTKRSGMSGLHPFALETEGLKIELRRRADELEEKLESLVILIREGGISVEEQRGVFVSVQQDYDGLLQEFRGIKADHPRRLRRIKAAGEDVAGVDEEFDPGKTLEGDIFRLERAIDDAHVKVEAAKRASNRTPSRMNVSSRSRANSIDDGVEDSLGLPGREHSSSNLLNSSSGRPNSSNHTLEDPSPVSLGRRRNSSDDLLAQASSELHGADFDGRVKTSTPNRGRRPPDAANAVSGVVDGRFRAEEEEEEEGVLAAARISNAATTGRRRGREGRKPLAPENPLADFAKTRSKSSIQLTSPRPRTWHVPGAGEALDAAAPYPPQPTTTTPIRTTTSRAHHDVADILTSPRPLSRGPPLAQPQPQYHQLQLYWQQQQQQQQLPPYLLHQGQAPPPHHLQGPQQQPFRSIAPPATSTNDWRARRGIQSEDELEGAMEDRRRRRRRRKGDEEEVDGGEGRERMQPRPSTLDFDSLESRRIFTERVAPPFDPRNYYDGADDADDAAPSKPSRPAPLGTRLSGDAAFSPETTPLSPLSADSELSPSSPPPLPPPPSSSSSAFSPRLQRERDRDSGFVGSEGSRQSRLSTMTPVGQNNNNNNNNEKNLNNNNVEILKRDGDDNNNNNGLIDGNDNNDNNDAGRDSEPATNDSKKKRTTPRPKSAHEPTRRESGDSSDGSLNAGKSSAEILRALQEEVKQLKEALQLQKLGLTPDVSDDDDDDDGEEYLDPPRSRRGRREPRSLHIDEADVYLPPPGPSTRPSTSRPTSRASHPYPAPYPPPYPLAYDDPRLQRQHPPQPPPHEHNFGGGGAFPPPQTAPGYSYAPYPPHPGRTSPAPTSWATAPSPASSQHYANPGSFPAQNIIVNTGGATPSAVHVTVPGVGGYSPTYERPNAVPVSPGPDRVTSPVRFYKREFHRIKDADDADDAGIETINETATPEDGDRRRLRNAGFLRESVSRMLPPPPPTRLRRTPLFASLNDIRRPSLSSGDLNPTSPVNARSGTAFPLFSASHSQPVSSSAVYARRGSGVSFPAPPSSSVWASATLGSPEWHAMNRSLDSAEAAAFELNVDSRARLQNVKNNLSRSVLELQLH